MKRELQRVLGAALVAAVFLIGMALPVCAAGPAQKNLILATTTSTQDSGLLDVLIPVFEKKTGYFVKTIAVGSGQAMAMGQKGEADVLLVHSPDAEKKFMAEGNGVNRLIVMHNDFIVVGPPADPAAIKGATSTVEAFQKIAAAGSLFMSRGDNSGTHAKEQGIWKAAGIKPDGQKWYQQTGLGMGQTLNVAAEKKGYTLADRGTWLSLQQKLGLPILKEGDPILLNVYHVIQVNPAKWPKVNVDGAKVFSDFMLSAETQGIIKTFGVEKYGGALFFPDAGKPEYDK
ncbi:MAG: substrate-binding domain-containing protein [Deltaproteobacteria bacterium]|nr:substrate-binding domain-containing protein [Deltaproteobacteria bacterium]